MSLNIHKNIIKKLDFFVEANKIPHIIFFGPSGSGKRYILNYLIDKIYSKDKTMIKEYCMFVNCAHGKGIRFIRDELKFFAKSNIQNKNGTIFKSIILFNAGNLTTDAQSALRRCIEKFSHTTRFFIIVNNTDSVLKPIISRFCNIHIPHPNINNNIVNLHKYNQKCLDNLAYFNDRREYLRNIIMKRANYKTINKCYSLALTLYEKGYSAIDLIKIIEEINFDNEIKYNLLIYFDKIRKEFRNEKTLLIIILYFFSMRKKIQLENILSI
jgi:DNA polymerase III delta prime subunit